MLRSLNGAGQVWLGHPDVVLTPDTLWRAWSWEPWLVVALGVTGSLYAKGIVAMWRRGGTGAGVRIWQAAAFAVGMSLLAAALLSPLSALGRVLFSAHMIQHTLLMLAAAPLLVLGRPELAMIWGLPRPGRRVLGRWASHQRVRRLWETLTRPTAAWAIHAAVLWVWHLPSLYQSTLHSDLIHHLQHATFLGSALLFWWVVLPHGRLSRGMPGYSVLLVFTTALHSSVLGALLTFAPVTWYPDYRPPIVWGLTPLEDQQLAGLVMWVPPGMLYLVASLLLFGTWLTRVEGRMPARPSSAGCLLLLALAACGSQPEAPEDVASGGVAGRGAVAFRTYGCGACHSLRGEPSAVGRVGPRLDNFGDRRFVGGSVPNRPEELVRWIQRPREINPLTAMPDLQVSEADARDLAAWLYSRP